VEEVVTVERKRSAGGTGRSAPAPATEKEVRGSFADGVVMKGWRKARGSEEGLWAARRDSSRRMRSSVSGVEKTKPWWWRPVRRLRRNRVSLEGKIEKRKGAPLKNPVKALVNNDRSCFDFLDGEGRVGGDRASVY
jgi:hypothetical protein